MIKILFYSIAEPYGMFSNFASYPIKLKGKIWPTVEHYFQAKKFTEIKLQEVIRNTKSPNEAAEKGRDRKNPLRRDWESVKDTIMRTAISAKVEQHSEVRDILLSTGNSYLVEHTENDSYWGDNGDGTGKNMLGKILMEVRNRQDEYNELFMLPPWLVFPQYNIKDLFWREEMGRNYINEYNRWKDGLSTEAKNEYEIYFLIPNDWI